MGAIGKVKIYHCLKHDRNGEYSETTLNKVVLSVQISFSATFGDKPRYRNAEAPFVCIKIHRAVKNKDQRWISKNDHQMTSALNSISLFIFGNTPLIFNFLCILLQTNMTYKTLKIYKIVSMYQKLKLQQPSTEETDNKSNQIKSQANAPINRRLCRNICEIISIDPDLRIKMLSLRSTNDNTKVRPSILKYR